MESCLNEGAPERRAFLSRMFLLPVVPRPAPPTGQSATRQTHAGRQHRAVIYWPPDADLRLRTAQNQLARGGSVMAAHRPEECDFQIADCINAGDLEGAVALYEAGARFVAGPDNVVEGSDGIREVMRSMLAGKPR